MKKNIKLAKLAGFCYGVKRAVETTKKLKKENPEKEIFVLGELIHNSHVIDELSALGIHTVEELPDNGDGICVIRSHGAAPEVFENVKQKGYETVDLTCPDVKKVQQKAIQLVEEGFLLIIVGKPEHPEVCAIKANAQTHGEHVIVAPDTDSLKEYEEEIKKHKRIGVVVQTTQRIENLQSVVNYLLPFAREIKVFNTISALSVGVLLLLFVAFISHKMRSVSSLVIGLIGGYLTPHLSGASGDLTYGYLIFLNLISLVYTLNNVKAKWINPVNLLITMFIMFAGCISDDVQKIVYPVVLWAVYIVYDLLRDKASKTDNIACVINYIFLTVMTLTLFKTSVKAVGIMFGVTALVYALLAFFGKKFQNPLYKRYEHYIFLNVWFSILFTLNDLYSILTWSVVAVLLSFAVEKNKLNAVKHYITVYYLSAVVGVLLAKDGSGFMLAEQYTPVLNIRSLIFLVPVLSMILSIVKLKSKESFICNCMRFNIVLLTYFYAVCEITHLLQIMNLEQSTLDYSLYMIYTTIGIVYSVVSHSIYSRTKFLLFNIASVLLWLVSVIMFVVGCFIHPEGLLPIINLRVLAFIAVLYFCSYFARATRLNFFRYLAVFLGFILCGAESSLLGAKLNINYITTLGWLLYSGAVTLWGILKSKKFLINSGIWIFIFTILRVFIFDLAKVASVYKIFAFLLLGIVLMVVSYIYVRLKSDKN